MIKRFNIQPDAANRPYVSATTSENSGHEKLQKDANDKSRSQLVTLWLLGGLCAGLAIGLFTKRR